MKYLILLFSVTFLNALYAQEQTASVLNKTIPVNTSQASVKQWFGTIENENIILSYNPNEINLERVVTVIGKNISVAELLRSILGRGFKLTAVGNKILIIKVPVKYVFSGFVREKGSRESLKGATITILNLGKGSVSNTYGFYSLSLPEGVYDVEISYIGYTSHWAKINIREDTNMDFFLKNYDTALTNVKIATAPPELQIKDNGLYRFNLTKKDQQPQLLGIDDPIKRLQFLPGISTGASSLNQLSIRGGNTSNNLVLLDGVPIYNYNHFSGVLSVFNNDALKYVDFYKGGFPARYNGRLASVIDIGMREGSMEKYHGGASIDFATASLFGEGPLIKNKASFLISARRSWADMLSKKLRKDLGVGYSLHDVNLKLNYRINNKNHIYLSVYKGADVFRDPLSAQKKNKALSWSNRMASFRWNHVFSNKLFGNATVSASRFANSLAQYYESDSLKGQYVINPNKTIGYKMSEYMISSDIDYYADIGHMRIGSKITKSDFTRPYLRAFYDILSAAQKETIRFSSLQWMSYYENEINIRKNTTVNLGLNYNMYNHNQAVFHRFQSRILINYTPVTGQTFFAGFSEMSQFFHQLSINALSLPYEFRMPATKQFPPGSSALYEAGYRGKFNKAHQLTASAYYNNSKGVIRYRLQQSVLDEFLATDLENQIISGAKHGKGVELLYFFKNTTGDATLSYSLSDFKERYNEIQNGIDHPASNTSKNMLKAMYTWHINSNNHLTCMFVYHSGQYITTPEYAIPDIDEVLNVNRPDQKNTFVTKNFNNYKLPDNYQFNLGYVLQKANSKGHLYTLRAGIYNISGRDTPYSIEIIRVGNSLKLAETYLPRFIPYLSYSFRF